MATVAVRPRRLASVTTRGLVWTALAAGIGLVGFTGPDNAAYATTAAIYVLIGLSLNVILGYTGQLSLGHQGLVGAGALFGAYVSAQRDVPFTVALLVGALAGAAFALVIGFVALRISGLYLALVTLVVGVTLQQSLFDVTALTGGGAGQAANRPDVLQPNDRYYLLCAALVVLFFVLDGRLTRSKAGRAFLAIKADERVAAANGVHVVGYKLLAFVISGLLAGLAGALLAFKSQEFIGTDYSFQLALTFVVMTVVGGAGSRVGVAVGSVFFAVLNTVIEDLGPFKSFAHLFPGQMASHVLQFGPGFIGALLLLLTLAFNPRGLAQQLDPVVRWLTRGSSDARPEPASVPVEAAHVRP